MVAFKSKLQFAEVGRKLNQINEGILDFLQGA